MGAPGTISGWQLVDAPSEGWGAPIDRGPAASAPRPEVALVIGGSQPAANDDHGIPVMRAGGIIARKDARPIGLSIKGRRARQMLRARQGEAGASGNRTDLREGHGSRFDCRRNVGHLVDRRGGRCSSMSRLMGRDWGDRLPCLESGDQGSV